MSPKGLESLRRLREDGHEIGPHFDAAAHEPEELEAAAARECDILERALDQTIDTISFHRPAKKFYHRRSPLPGDAILISLATLRRLVTVPIARRLALRHPLDHEAVVQGTAMQLLTHPLWCEPPAAPEEKLQRFMRDRFETIDHQLARECDVHTANRISITSL